MKNYFYLLLALGLSTYAAAADEILDAEKRMHKALDHLKITDNRESARLIDDMKDDLQRIKGRSHPLQMAREENSLQHCIQQKIVNKTQKGYAKPRKKNRKRNRKDRKKMKNRMNTLLRLHKEKHGSLEKAAEAAAMLQPVVATVVSDKIATIASMGAVENMRGIIAVVEKAEEAEAAATTTEPATEPATA